MKSKALKGTASFPSDSIVTDAALAGGPVASDVRTWHMRLIKSAGVAATVGLLYPRMLPIHSFAEDVGFRGENGRIKLPPLMRISYARMEPHGAYLIGAFLSPSKRASEAHDFATMKKMEKLRFSGWDLPSLRRFCKISTAWRIWTNSIHEWRRFQHFRLDFRRN